MADPFGRTKGGRARRAKAPVALEALAKMHEGEETAWNELFPLQAQLLVSVASGASIGEACDSFRISRKQWARWFSQCPAFCYWYYIVRQKPHKFTQAMVARLVPKAIARVEAMLSSKNERIVLDASALLFKHGLPSEDVRKQQITVTVRPLIGSSFRPTEAIPAPQWTILSPPEQSQDKGSEGGETLGEEQSSSNGDAEYVWGAAEHCSSGEPCAENALLGAGSQLSAG